MQLIDKYRRDVTQLLADADKKNFASIVKAIELTSHYAALALDEGGLEADSADALEYSDAKPLVPEQNGTEAAPAVDKQFTDDVNSSVAASTQNVGEIAPASDEFKVERKLIGAIAGNHFFTEAAVRELDLADGDTVRVREDLAGTEDEVTIIDRNRSTAAPRIEQIRFAMIQRDESLPADYNFKAEKDLHGDVLMRTDEGLPFTFLIKPTDAARLGLKDGDLVDLSWYRTDGPQLATVTWVYKDKKGLKPLQKHLAKPKKKQEKAAAGADDTAADVVTAKTYDPQLDFDLDGKSVLLIGNVASATGLGAVVAAHNGGEVTATDSQKGGQLKHKLSRAGVAVLITDEVHHITTNTSIKIAKKLKVPYAVANSDAPLMVERALYRAIAGMPAYEASNAQFEYPEK